MMALHPLALVRVLVLLAVANGTPLAVKKVCGRRWRWPLDGDLRLGDGRPLFGPSKTWRGAVLAILATTAAGPLVGLDWAVGAEVGGLAMAGDLLSSFAKRRLGLAPSSRATGLDQIPEALLPLLAVAGNVGLDAVDIAAGVAVFFFGEVLLSRLLFRLRLRDRPY